MPFQLSNRNFRLLIVATMTLRVPKLPEDQVTLDSVTISLKSYLPLGNIASV